MKESDKNDTESFTAVVLWAADCRFYTAASNAN